MSLTPKETDTQALHESIRWGDDLHPKDLSAASREWAEESARLVDGALADKDELIQILQVAFDAGRYYQTRATGI